MVLGAYALIAFWQYRHWCADPSYAGAYCYEVRDPLEIAMIAGAAAGGLRRLPVVEHVAGADLHGRHRRARPRRADRAAWRWPPGPCCCCSIIGGLFVIITMSVVIQIVSFQTTGKRVFRMSPLQHHFELAGWSEVNIVVRFWIIAGIGVAIGAGPVLRDFLARDGLTRRRGPRTRRAERR